MKARINPQEWEAPKNWESELKGSLQVFQGNFMDDGQIEHLPSLESAPLDVETEVIFNKLEWQGNPFLTIDAVVCRIGGAMNLRGKVIAEPATRAPAGSRGAPAFTLIELSIVLVIIGLLVGGVLVGQDLIRAAGMRATITQIEKYNTAVRTFQLKYNNYLPGDMPDPDATNFGFHHRGTVPGTGDGNGVLEGIWCGGGGICHNGYSHGGGETTVFWVDLSIARLIDGGFNTAIADGVNPTPNGQDPAGATLDLFLPQAKLGRGNYIYAYSGGVLWDVLGNPVPPSGINYFGLSAVTTIAASSSGQVLSNPGVTVQEAYSIDKKTDDGLPQSGNVTAVYNNATVITAGQLGTLATTGSATTCYDNSSAASGTPGIGGAVQHYSLEMSGGTNINCALSFRFQ